MNKKIVWAIVIVLILAAIGYGAYWWGSKKSSMNANQAAQAISNYLNQSQAMVQKNPCAAFQSDPDNMIVDVGGKYKGVWSGGSIVGVCY